MNPKYKFSLTTDYNGITHDYAVSPLYDSNLSKDFEREQGEMFFRAKLNGKITFVGSDYDIINNARFETRFMLVISVSLDDGATWSEYWRGEFWKTDCKFNVDNRNVEIKATPADGYSEVLAGLEKEYNLIDLMPEIDNVMIAKRPLVQVYVPGESVVSCFLSGMYWEQDCDEVTSDDELINRYHFSLNKSVQIAQVTADPDMEVPGIFYGEPQPNKSTPFEYTNGEYTFRLRRTLVPQTYLYHYEILHNDVTLWSKTFLAQNLPDIPFEMEMSPVEGSGAVGNVKVYMYVQKVYSRYLLDVEEIAGMPTAELSAEDIVENNRNYHRVIGYGFTDVIYFSSQTTTTPTEWGIKQPGEYWQKPYLYWNPELYPVGRSHWGDLSIWFTFSSLDDITEKAGRKEYRLRDAFPLSSVISVLLNKIAPGIKHEATSEYSHFLYDSFNPISYRVFELLITPKSNILAGEYTQPAQKAPITLKAVTDMLRNCFRAYWYIEGDKFKIEHIQWFRNGGSYTGNPEISYDLTAKRISRNGKTLAYGTSQFEYNKLSLPERYQFRWMDESTKAFEGMPIEIISRFVNAGNIEEITLNSFSTDVDYMLLNPSSFSEDGFVLMGAKLYNSIPVDDASRNIPSEGIVYPLSNVKAGEVLRMYLHVTTYAIVNLVDELGQVTRVRELTRGGDYVVDVEITEGITSVLIKRGTARMASVRVVRVSGTYFLPFVQRTEGNAEYVNQNGFLSFIHLLPDYYLYDMPAYEIRVNGEATMAFGIKREKKQTLRFPLYADPDPMKLIKTYVGVGQIEKISVNLSSRNANVTLMFDTYSTNE